MHTIHIWHASMHATGPTDGLSSTVDGQRGIAVHHIERHRWVALVLNMGVFFPVLHNSKTAYTGNSCIHLYRPLVEIST